MIPRSAFPVRPTLEPGESLIGYLCRWHWSNGHQIQPNLAESAEALYTGSDSEANFEVIQNAIGFINRLEPNWWVTQRIDLPLANEPIPMWRKLHFGRMRFCRRCLKDSAYHFSLWELPLVEACPRHGYALITHCEKCGSSLRFRNLEPSWKCHCGTSITSNTDKVAAAWKVRLASLIAESQNSIAPPHLLIADASINYPNSHSLQDIYDVMYWAFQFRGAIGKRSQYTPWDSWPARKRYIQRRGLERAPGQWEAKLLSKESESLLKFLKLALKFIFRYQSPKSFLLVSDDRIKTIEAFIARLNPESNVFSSALHHGFIEGKRQFSAQISSYPNLLFHPGLRTCERMAQLQKLAYWWHKLAKQISPLDKSFMLPIFGDPSDRYPYLHLSTAGIEEIINLIYAASSQNLDVEHFSVLTHRWHIPRHLQVYLAPQKLLDALSEYFTTITHAEKLFFLKLFRYGLGRSAL